MKALVKQPTPDILPSPLASAPRRWRLGRTGSAYAFFLPAFVVVAATSFVPLVYAITQSFRASGLMGMGPFVGLENYARFFTSANGWTIVLQTLQFVAGSVAIAVPLGVALALLLNRNIAFRTVFRTILILPWLVSNLVVALLWAWLLNGRFGPIAGLLDGFGIEMVNAVTTPTLAMIALSVANAWHSYPLVMLFVLAALQTIPADLYEAARIDGASPWQRFRLITLPLIRNTTMVVMVLTTLHSFNNVTMVFVMTGGGPIGSTDTLALRVFLEEFKFNRTGVAAAGAVVIFALNLAFSLAYARVLRGDRAA